MKKLIVIAAILFLVSIVCTVFPFNRLAEGTPGGVTPTPTPTPSPAQCTPPPSGMVDWWGGDNNALDIIGTNHGTLMGGVTYGEGIVRQAFSFHGTLHDYVKMTSSTAGDFGSSPFTVDFWMNSSNDGNGGVYLVGKSYPDYGQGWDIRLRTSQIVVVGVNGWAENIISDTSVTSGAWHHIALTANGSDVILYIDNVQKGSSGRSAISSTTNPFSMGDTPGFSVPTAFNGLIDEVQIFNRALSADEIADIYNAGSAGLCGPPHEVWVKVSYHDGGANDGHTWGYDAFATIQNGINGVSGSTVHVAAGTYRENIILKDGVELLGAGNATTIINGMKNGSVITANNVGNTTIIDGFTVTNGSAVSGGGGGMWNDDSSPAISNCTFNNNSAGGGGGMYNNNQSTPVISNCTFDNNSATYGGGGMVNSASSPTLTTCTFSNNSATDNGGGMYNDYSTPTVTNCTFANNLATYGGGMYNDYSSPTVTNCPFINNSATASGGGMYNVESSTQPNITNCVFQNNSASSNGGGMYNSLALPTINNSTFRSNSAFSGGGIYNSDSSSPTITNCIFQNNSASAYGGGMYNRDASSPTITNCAFQNNSAINRAGGGIYNIDSSTQPIITNCILWNDSPDEIVNNAATPSVTYCDVQGALYTGTGNINASPMVVNAAGGDLHLAGGSPCIDTGNNAALFMPSTDKDGVTRPLDGDGNGTAIADMGAYEAPVHISEAWIDDDYYDGGTNDGHTWGINAFAKIQDGIDAVSGSTVHVAAGTYYENIVLKDGVELLGAGNDSTTINGMQNGSVITATNVGNTSRVDGFTVTNGSAVNGGGMYNSNASAVITNCTFQGNSAYYAGGGMYNDDSSPAVTNCTFQGNSAGYYGGGMYNYYGASLAVTNCTFQSNSADYGGGMYNDDSSPAVTNCSFQSNSADDRGGGMYNSGSSPTITNCTFQSNSTGASGYGGGMCNNGASPTIKNCTFQSNSADYGGGGMYNTGSSTKPIITDSTFQNNSVVQTDGEGGGMCNYFNSSPAVTNCSFQSNSAGSGSGMYNYQSSPAVTNSTFKSNSANDGGGISNDDHSSPAVTNCSFQSNTANRGGGIYNDHSSLTITNCTFLNNSATQVGGGMSNEYSSSPTITVCAFINNSARNGGWGGGMTNYESCSPTITNCTFLNNSAGSGGGMVNDLSSRPTITNCTFLNNSASSGGGMFNERSASPTITNCILWNGSPDEIHNDTGNGATANVTYCDVQGALYPGTGNINASPMFANAAGGDIHLTIESPCIDVGNNSAPSIPAKDFEGDARISNGRVDIGADEVVSTTPRANSQIKIASSTKSASYGQTVTFTATVSAVSVRKSTLTPTGTITFMDGATIIAPNVPLSGKKATFTTNALMPGSHAITAVYSGDANFNGSTSSALNILVRKAVTSTTIVSSINPSQSGNPVTFTATVRTAALVLGAPTGTVTFKDGRTILGVIALDGSGQATYTTAALYRGTHVINAVYSGDGNFSGSSRTLLQRVNYK